MGRLDKRDPTEITHARKTLSRIEAPRGPFTCFLVVMTRRLRDEYVPGASMRLLKTISQHLTTAACVFSQSHQSMSNAIRTLAMEVVVWFNEMRNVYRWLLYSIFTLALFVLCYC